MILVLQDRMWLGFPRNAGFVVDVMDGRLWSRGFVVRAFVDIGGVMRDMDI
jgi:hypothetical protein